MFPSTVFFVVGHYFVAAGGVLSITGYRQLGINVKEVFYSIPFFFFLHHDRLFFRFIFLVTLLVRWFVSFVGFITG